MSVNAPPGMRIVSIRPDSLFSPNAPPEQGYRVEFVTPLGHRSYVQVPRTDHWSEDAEEAMTREAERIDGLSAKYAG